ncbi:MAG TPA: exonuclease [Lachnospiraceae bacterium]|nr:exonuclease [Lachnospiraceae bacterium]
MLTVLDFEFNQAFDFGGQQGRTDPRCRFEIIQIGAVTVDEEYHITKEYEQLIKPRIYPRIHPYVEKITGLTTSVFKNQPHFEEVYPEFREFIGNDEVLGVWGSSDIKALFRNLSFYNMTGEGLIIKYTDIQAMATKALQYKNGVIGLKNAVDACNLEIDRPFHNALDDAWYTAKVLEKINPEKLKLKLFNSARITAFAEKQVVVKNRRSKSNRTRKKDR